MRQGLFFAAAFTTLGAVGWVLGDADLRAGVRQHLAGLLAFYWVGGALGGALVGACRPAMRRRGAAVLLGALVGTLLIAVIAAWSMGAGALADWRVWCLAAAFGGPTGAGSGWTMWGQARRPGAPPGAGGPSA